MEETSSIIHDDIVSMDILLDGDTISHVGIREREIVVYGCRTKIGSIGGVATEPEYRNRGLATRLISRFESVSVASSLCGCPDSFRLLRWSRKGTHVTKQ